METSTPATLSPLAKFRRDVAINPNICRKIQPCEPPAPARICMTFQVSDAFAAEIDRARGFKSRSDFIRAAIFAYLEKHTESALDKDWQRAPNRCGKGGRSKKVTLPAIGDDDESERPQVAEIITGPWGPRCC